MGIFFTERDHIRIATTIRVELHQHHQEMEWKMTKLVERLDNALQALQVKVDEVQEQVLNRGAERDAEIARLQGVVDLLQANPSSNDVERLVAQIESTIADLEGAPATTAAASEPVEAATSVGQPETATEAAPEVATEAVATEATEEPQS